MALTLIRGLIADATAEREVHAERIRILTAFIDAATSYLEHYDAYGDGTEVAAADLAPDREVTAAPILSAEKSPRPGRRHNIGMRKPGETQRLVLEALKAEPGLKVKTLRERVGSSSDMALQSLVKSRRIVKVSYGVYCLPGDEAKIAPSRITEEAHTAPLHRRPDPAVAAALDVAQAAAPARVPVNTLNSRDQRSDGSPRPRLSLAPVRPPTPPHLEPLEGPAPKKKCPRCIEQGRGDFYCPALGVRDGHYEYHHVGCGHTWSISRFDAVRSLAAPK